MNKLKGIIHNIIQSELGDTPVSITRIEDLGSVNLVYDVSGLNENYIVRLNEDPSKKIEYRKEKWCINKVSTLGIPSPTILSTGFRGDTVYMIQRKIPGQNGKLCAQVNKAAIWQTLGQYARKFHGVANIEDAVVEQSEFHDSWRARLTYNLKELNPQDSLLQKNILSAAEHKQAKQMLSTLLSKTFKTGLVHGDLCPRNVIYHKGETSLLDWGTAEVNVVPHNELGVILMSGEASKDEFRFFLEGYGISASVYKDMEKEINLLNFLHVLDKYRWAEGYQVENIEEFERNVLRYLPRS